MTATTPGPDLLGTFSFSAGQAYERCPAQFHQRHGDGRRGGPADERTEDDVEINDVWRRRGIVLHDALRVAFESARIEVDQRGVRLTGDRMMRYWRPARIELGASWDRNLMPSDPMEAQLVIDLLTSTLTTLPVPAPGAIHSIEQRRTYVTPAGVGVHYVIDYSEWIAPRRLLIRDWKSGKVDAQEVRYHPQLHCYAAWLDARGMPGELDAIEIELYSLRHGEGYRQRVDMDKARRFARRLEATAVTALADVTFAPNPGKHCGGCFYRASCPAVASIMPRSA